MNNDELTNILLNGEDVDYEFKKSQDSLSEDVWETYSAFANTNGGVIYLGIKEKNDKFTILGVNNAKNMKKQFFDCINNKNKVNTNILNSEDVEIITIDTHDVIKITVPRATRAEKPIYINNNPMTGTYKRNHSGDYKCTESEIRRMFAEQSDTAKDNVPLDDTDISDINVETLALYRKRFSIVRGTTHAWVALSDIDFLYQIGAIGKDKKHLTLAGLLMFGNEREITTILPNYFLDYREVNSENVNERWSNRITSSDGSWSGNLYDFYFKIINRLTSDLSVPFKLENNSRNDDTIVHVAIREALTNTLVHPDYNETGSILIEKNNNTFVFSNPGTLRIPKERALKGGESDPRNPTLHKMFSLIGLGERAGSGLITIQNAWKNQHWQRPVLEELVQPDKIVLTLKTISLIPTSTLNSLKELIGNEYSNLANNEILALAYAHQYQSVNNINLQNYAEINSYESNKILSNLVNKKLLITTGSGRGMKYIINSFYPNDYTGEVGSNLSNNEINIGDNGNNIGDNGENIGGNTDNLGGNNDNLIKQTNDSEEKYILEIVSLTAKKKRLSPEIMMDLIIKICSIKPLSAKELGNYLNRDSEFIQKEYVSKLIKENKLFLLYPDKLQSPNQKYYAK